MLYYIPGISASSSSESVNIIHVNIQLSTSSANIRRMAASRPVQDVSSASHSYPHTGTGSQLTSKAVLRAYGPKAVVLLLQTLRGTVSQPQCHTDGGNSACTLPSMGRTSAQPSCRGVCRSTELRNRKRLFGWVTVALLVPAEPSWPILASPHPDGSQEHEVKRHALQQNPHTDIKDVPRDFCSCLEDKTKA